MSSLEDTLKAFIQERSQNIQGLNQAIQESNQAIQKLKNVAISSSQAIQEFKNVAISNSQNLQELKQFTHQAFVKMEVEIDYLAVEFNIIKEEEFQSQLMAREHYMIDEYDASHSSHENVPYTTILERTEIVDNNEEEEKDEQIEHIDQVEHKEQVENIEKIKPPADTSLSIDKEVNTEAHSFIIVPFAAHHESKASILQCLKEPSYAKILKDLCKQAHKSRNHRPKKIFPSKQVGYLRW
jgi:hypothetical protein